MSNLKDELDNLHKLNDYRNQAKKLREKALKPLKQIINIHSPVPNEKKAWIEGKQTEEFSDWICSGNNVEVALAVRVQNHRDLSENENYNNFAEATNELKSKLLKTNLDSIFTPDDNFPEPPNIDSLKSVPVVTAARTMYALATRSETTFSKATFLCYYRIMRELYGAASPDWTVGAARAGGGGATSAFVTGECVRAIFAFQDTITRTAGFFCATKLLLERYERLKNMDYSLGKNTPEDHPLRSWATQTIRAMWLEYWLSTNLRHKQIALFYNPSNKTDEKDIPINKLLISDENEVNLETLETYFTGFIADLESVIKNHKDIILAARMDILSFRNDEEVFQYSNDGRKLKDELRDTATQKIKKEFKPKIERYYRTESAHLFALQVIEDALDENAAALVKIQNCKLEIEKGIKQIQNETTDVDLQNRKILDLKISTLKKLLERFANDANRIASRVHRVAEPTRRYLKSVLHRELSALDSVFDAGELVFAAAAFGAMTDWKPNELLNRVCQKLVEALPESGRLPTTRPLHTTSRGYRLLPIGCEMTQSLAQLLNNVRFEFQPSVVGRMLNMFEEKLIPAIGEIGFTGWNFDRSSNPDKPCLWVTAVAVLALDRVVRMLNSRINETIFKHFEVDLPERPHTKLTLNSIVYGDHGFDLLHFKEFPEDYKNPLSIPIALELMRSHLTRAALPKDYQIKKENKIFSSILYGPPGTGKTTLAEALASTCKSPVVKLSPNDLMVTGKEHIEGRARDVFDALSMLTQTVIIFDEFETILKSRLTDFEKSNTDTDQEKLIKTLQAISEREDPSLRFLLGGLLPKLIKLHDAAEKQSLVYFLGTNVLKDIDNAAKRIGRFDLKIPVYNACPLSRAGAFLYRLNQFSEGREKLDLNNKEQLARFLEVIVATANEPSRDLFGKFLRYNLNENEQLKPTDSKNFEYVISGNEDFKPEIDQEKIGKILDDITTMRLERIEEQEYAWLLEYEQSVKEKFYEIKQKTKPLNQNALAECFNLVERVPFDSFEKWRVVFKEKVETFKKLSKYLENRNS